MKFILSYFVILAVMLLLLLPESVCFGEQWRTFYWDAAYCQDMLRNTGGLSQLVSDFVKQFMGIRWCAALLIALPFTLAAWILKHVMKSAKLKRTIYRSVIVLPMLACLCYMFYTSSRSEENQFKSMMCMVEDEDWVGVLDYCEGRKMNNLLQLNMRNLALAETGQLTKRLTEQPHNDVNCLMVMEIQSPYVAAMLSDIYWSMGEISMSQMYAFEANEKLDNLSPRLLKRLVKTNITFGHYEVAVKYLNWLDKTLFYREWADHYRTLLSDEAVMADAEIRVKRACIPDENCFPSTQSVVYDLKKITDNNPEHQTSKQYLGALEKMYAINFEQTQN